MSKLIKTQTGYKLSNKEDRVTIHHTDGDWLVLAENQSCYYLTKGSDYCVRSKDTRGTVTFYNGDSECTAYDTYCKVGEMQITIKFA